MKLLAAILTASGAALLVLGARLVTRPAPVRVEPEPPEPVVEYAPIPVLVSPSARLSAVYDEIAEELAMSWQRGAITSRRLVETTDALHAALALSPCGARLSTRSARC